MFEKLVVPANLIPSDPRFGVGPSLVPKSYLENLVFTVPHLLGTSHRQAAVVNLVKELQLGIKKYFNLPSGYEVLLGNGGATFLFDMIGLGLVEKKSAHFTCGEFSQKWFKAHQNIPWIEAEEIAVDFGQGQNPTDIADADMICCTLNETSTAVMINSIPDLRNSDKLLAVDATSGAGQIPIDFNKVDLYFFSPQKVFAGEGGLYVAIVSPKAIARIEKLKPRKSYIPEVMKWSHALENSLKHQTYNTPSVMNLFLINEQVKAMNLLGEKKVIELAQKKAQLIYDWAQSKDYLSCYIKDESFRSIAVATIDVEDRYPMGDLTKKLRDLGVVYDIDGYRKLGRNQLRIGLFHNISLVDLEKLTKIISLAIEDFSEN
jgi:phosphoserine aminotransferase